MKRLSEFLYEKQTTFNPEPELVTDEWMKEAYTKYNKEVFDNELPNASDVELKTTKINSMNIYGQMRFGIPIKLFWRAMRDGMYVMYSNFPNEKPKPLTNIVDAKPSIVISNRHKFNEAARMELLIHEMIHLWVERDCLCPKRSHGKEFAAKCKEVNAKCEKLYGRKFHLGTHVNGEDDMRVEANVDRTATKKLVDGNVRKQRVVYHTYVILKSDTPEDHRLHFNSLRYIVFCSKGNLKKLIEEIKNHPKIKGYIEHLYVGDNAYRELCIRDGKYRITKTVKDFDYYVWDKFDAEYRDRTLRNGATDVMETNLKESYLAEGILKKAFNKAKEMIKDAINWYIEIPSDTNASEIDIDDIFNDVIDAADDPEEEGSGKYLKSYKA